MGKKGGGKDQASGFFGKLFQPLKKQRVTLTKAGKKQAPLRKGKVEAKKQEKNTPAPKTQRERQVQELKTLANIGKKNPERLAGIISKMLQEALAQEDDARLKFERLIWEKADKHQSKRDKPDEK